MKLPEDDCGCEEGMYGDECAECGHRTPIAHDYVLLESKYAELLRLSDEMADAFNSVLTGGNDIRRYAASLARYKALPKWKVSWL